MSDIYDRTVDEQLSECTVTCGTHGELDLDEITFTMDGQLVCDFCSLDQEMDVRNEFDIDPSIEISP